MVSRLEWPLKGAGAYYAQLLVREDATATICRVRDYQGLDQDTHELKTLEQISNSFEERLNNSAACR